jgi:transglutaminase/protease-like cytokinesis protein 3
MKSFLILFLLFCGIERSVAQYDNTYYDADRIGLNIPTSQTNNTADIAVFINAHFDTNTKKVRAIYTWVTSNIKYDADSVHRVILMEDKEQLITSALKRKRGVCENFASVFSDICNKAGLPSFVIEGYTKQNSSLDKSTHAWSTTRIDNKWFLYDPTWDIGFRIYSISHALRSDVSIIKLSR